MIALHGTEEPGRSLLFTAESFFEYPFFVKNLVKKYRGDFKPQTFVEIGGSVATNAQGLFEDCTYHNIDLVDNPKIPTIIADVTKGIPLESNSVDFVYSNDAFEHLAKPWVTANEIIRILKPGGICFIGTLFAWRYHPVPEDYFRFTPAGLCTLFEDMTILESNFNMHWRRDDIKGFWKSKHDSVPLDMLGGWRENWKVFMLAQKTSKQIEENPRMPNPVEETKQIEENPRMPIPVKKTKEIDENLKMPNSVEETNVAIIERDFVHETEVAHKVWENSKDEEYRKDQSRWRGCGRWTDDERWQRIGKGTLNNLTQLAAFCGFRSDFWLKPHNILEWGSGGGSNLFSLAKYSKTYYGVDISEKNLNEAERMIQAESYHNLKKVLIKEPSDVFIQIDEPIDIFLSTAVFQHFPTKEYGEAVLNILSKVCRKGALGFIQIRFDNGNETYKPINDISEYEKRHIIANSYRIDEFYDMCSSNGFRVHYMTNLLSYNNYITYNLARL